ncbi:MAG TPA: hypothetical protein VMD08_13610, partial [Candidatus Baltobacteraceae bacterium]|nr:hypothetical protein [Candidatus Baltobacteraceae bacterium]
APIQGPARHYTAAVHTTQPTHMEMGVATLLFHTTTIPTTSPAVICTTRMAVTATTTERWQWHSRVWAWGRWPRVPRHG